jgi:hypothetical protein
MQKQPKAENEKKFSHSVSNRPKDEEDLIRFF